MNLWYKKSIVFVLAGISYLVGQYFRGVWWPMITWPFPCQEIHSGSIIYCNSPYLDTFGWPLITLGSMLAIVAVILLIANERAWHTFLRFSYWYVPSIAIIVIFVFPISMPLGTFLSRERAIYNFVELYAIITFIIVGWNFLTAKERERKDKQITSS